MYIRLINGAHERYSLRALAADHPEVSFPDAPTAELLASYDIHPLTRAPVPEHDPLTQILREGAPVQHQGKWVLGWEVETLDADRAAQTIRAARDRQLVQTDWIIVKQIEQGAELSQDWVAYRQALRDLPDQPGFPFEIIWPLPPSPLTDHSE